MSLEFADQETDYGLRLFFLDVKHAYQAVQEALYLVWTTLPLSAGICIKTYVVLAIDALVKRFPILMRLELFHMMICCRMRANAAVNISQLRDNKSIFKGQENQFNETSRREGIWRPERYAFCLELRNVDLIVEGVSVSTLIRGSSPLRLADTPAMTFINPHDTKRYPRCRKVHK